MCAGTVPRILFDEEGEELAIVVAPTADELKSAMQRVLTRQAQRTAQHDCDPGDCHTERAEPFRDGGSN